MKIATIGSSYCQMTTDKTNKTKNHPSFMKKSTDELLNLRKKLTKKGIDFSYKDDSIDTLRKKLDDYKSWVKKDKRTKEGSKP